MLSLHADQTFIVDVSLNGEYTQPDSAAKWIGAAGREGVHAAMLTFVRGSVDSSLIERLSQSAKALKLAIIAHRSNELISQRVQAVRELFETLRPTMQIYEQGQQLYIMATVTDAAKASQHIRAGATVGGIQLDVVSDANPWQRSEELANAIQKIGLIVDDVIK